MTSLFIYGKPVASAEELLFSEAYWAFCMNDGSPACAGNGSSILFVWSSPERQRSQAHVFLHAGNNFDAVGQFSADEVKAWFLDGWRVYIDPALSLMPVRHISPVAA